MLLPSNNIRGYVLTGMAGQAGCVLSNSMSSFPLRAHILRAARLGKTYVTLWKRLCESDRTKRSRSLTCRLHVVADAIAGMGNGPRG